MTELKSDYKALQVKYEWRLASDVILLNSLTLSKAHDNAAGALENQNGNFPGPLPTVYRGPYEYSSPLVEADYLPQAQRLDGQVAAAH